MAIIKCAKCGSEISDKSTNCMICGFKVSDTLKKIAHEEMVKRNAPKTEEHVSSVTLSEPKKDNKKKENNKNEDTVEIVQIGEKNLKEVHDPSYKELKIERINKILAAIVIILLILLMGGCGYYAHLSNEALKKDPTQKTNPYNTDGNRHTFARDETTAQARIKNEEVFFYKEKSLDSERIGVLRKGDIYKYLGSEEADGLKWHKLQLSDNTIGYVTNTTNSNENIEVLDVNTTTKSTTTTTSTSTTTSKNTSTSNLVSSSTSTTTKTTVTTKSTTKSSSSTKSTSKSTTKSTSSTKSTTKSTSTKSTTKKKDTYTYEAEADSLGQVTIYMFKNGKDNFTFPALAIICKDAACSPGKSLSTATAGKNKFLVTPENKSYMMNSPKIYLKICNSDGTQFVEEYVVSGEFFD